MWRILDVTQWSTAEITDWLMCAVNDLNIETESRDLLLGKLASWTGHDVNLLSRSDFETLSRRYGPSLFQHLRRFAPCGKRRRLSE
ncbi:hypothetical protein DPMN_006786 [Dreissena polymorpha]|uniref:SAM domain-containing protein n=1 Tax=Dreissena polymorpha TaxID=45954 RepID=A0A9D4RVA8_DREPO|nr:hypothetical protein DPMN_006786 [Dreissena polymorpha]